MKCSFGIFKIPATVCLDVTGCCLPVKKKTRIIKIFGRLLTRFAAHVGFTIDNLHKYLSLPKEKLTGDLVTFAEGKFTHAELSMYVSV